MCWYNYVHLHCLEIEVKIMSQKHHLMFFKSELLKGADAKKF